MKVKVEQGKVKETLVVGDIVQIVSGSFEEYYLVVYLYESKRYILQCLSGDGMFLPRKYYLKELLDAVRSELGDSGDKNAYYKIYSQDNYEIIIKEVK